MAFDPDAFLAEDTPNAAQPSSAQPSSAQPSSAQPSSGFDPDAFLASEAPVGAAPPAGDPLRPEYANGSTVETAINESPLTPDDRLAMSLGNKAGRFDFLKKKFGDVVVDRNGDFSVKTDNKWHKVDPNTLEGVSFIDATARIMKGVSALGLTTAKSIGKQMLFPSMQGAANPLSEAASLVDDDAVASETVKEIAGAIPAIGATVASIGVGVLTGGASLAVQAAAAAAAAVAVETGRTSLGRLEGTYQATAEQQIKDVGYESLLNMAGVVVPVGVKFGMNKFASTRAAKAVSEFFQTLPSDKQVVVRNTFGRMSGISDETFDRLATKGNGVQGMIDERSGASFQGFADVMNDAAAGEVGQLGIVAKKAVSDIFEGNYQKALAAIPDNARINASDLTWPLMAQFAGDGIVKRNLSGAYEMLSFKEYQHLQKSLGLADDAALVAFDKNSYKTMHELFNAASSLSETRGLRGQDGAKQVINVGRILKEMTLQAAEAGDASKNSTLVRLASKMGATVQEAVPKALETAHPIAAAAMRAANSAYSNMSQTMAPLIAAGRDPVRAAQLLSTMTSKAVSKAPTRVVIQQLAGQLDELGQNQAAKATRELLDSIADRRAAIEFAKPMSQQLGVFQAASMTGIMGAAVATMNPLPLLTVPVAIAMASPRAAKAAFETGLRFNNMIRNIPKNKLSETLMKTDALELGAKSILGAARLHDQAKGQALQSVGIEGEAPQ